MVMGLFRRLALVWILQLALSYELRLRVQPGRAEGGLEFLEQPQLEILEDGSEELAKGFLGYGTCHLYSRPSGQQHQEVWKDGGTSLIETAASFSGGRATFSGLSISGAGVGYELRFTAYTSAGVGVAFVDSEPLDVQVGDAYSIAFVAPVGSVWGGETFEDAPVVAVRDKGGNDVTYFSGGFVHAFLAEAPEGGFLQPSHSVRSKVVRGYADLSSLRIDKAGSDYVLAVNTSLTLAGVDYLESEPFTVAVGPPNRLVLSEDPVNGTIRAGVPFEVQPTVMVYDAGGNVLDEDSESAVLVAIHKNTAKASLGPDDKVFEVLDAGVATFGSLSIDRVGYAMSLRFTLYEYDHFSDDWHETGIFADSASFHVREGPVRGLRVDRSIDGGWAGGRAFKGQPHLSLVDCGMNVVTADNETVVVASITPSLAVSYDVAVDTSADAAVHVLDVSTTSALGTAAVGDEVPIQVTFNAEVVVDTAEGSAIPTLSLNNSASAVLVNSTTNTTSSVLTFLYSVGTGDESGFLAYSDVDALELNGASMVDLLGRSANITLPSVGQNGSLSGGAGGFFIDTAVPYVTAVGTSLDSGEYGVGQALVVAVNFSFPVTVATASSAPPPLFPLELNATNLVYATYFTGSGSNQLLFKYSVKAGDSFAAGVSFPSTGALANITLPVVDWETYSVPAAVLQASEDPTLYANVSLKHLTGDFGANITIDTTRPSVDSELGVWARSNGTFYALDEVLITVSFTKPVSVEGDVGLRLETGSTDTRAELHSGGNGTTDVTFMYRVKQGDTASLLNYKSRFALELGGHGAVYRHSTAPSQTCDLDLLQASQASRSLADTSVVVIDGGRPKAISVALNSATSDNSTLRTGDEAYVDVVFDKPLFVRGDPVLVLNVGRAREATYVSGNLSSNMTFKYTARKGDYADTLSYRFTDALCAESGCPAAASTSTGAVGVYGMPLHTQGVVGVAANWLLPNALGQRTEGVPIAANLSVDTSGGASTTVQSISTTRETGPWGVGQQIDVSLVFTDEVDVGTRLPRLALSNGALATYYEGGGTDTLTFLYTVGEGDNSTEALDVDMTNSTGTGSALHCSSGICALTDGNGAAVDMTLGANLTLAQANVTIDTSPPRVTDVYSAKATSEYSGGVYTVGEELDVSVRFDLPVVVRGTPRLRLETGGYATYSGLSSDGLVLSFAYLVIEGDSSTNLTWWGVGDGGAALDANADSILRLSSRPTTAANLSLPLVAAPLARGGNTIALNTTGQPVVTNVSSLSAEGSVYAPGDELWFEVTFDRSVSVSGVPVLHLDTGNCQPGRAYYSHGSGNTSLAFVYTAQEGDSTPAVRLSDTHALHFGYSEDHPDRHIATGRGEGVGYEEGLRSSIRWASTSPTVGASKQLDVPEGIIGSPAIDGAVPRIVALDFQGGQNESYAGGDVVGINVTFSAPVMVVNGTPSIKLETGPISRRAHFVGLGPDGNATEGSELLFEYTVVTGDSASDLDYWSDASEWRHAAASFELNGGGVYRAAGNAVLEADTHLNPPGGWLSGDTQLTAVAGEAHFRDLMVLVRGRGYRVWFSAQPRHLQNASSLATSLTFEAGFSVETEVHASDGASGDKMGWSVKVDGDMLITGAPGKSLATSEVQLLKLTGGRKEQVSEVQLVSVEAVQQKEIQQFTTSADVSASVGGHWSLTYPGLGSMRTIPADATIDQVQVFIQEDWPSLGRVRVSREVNTFCECTDGFVWTVNFEEAEGEVATMIPDGSLLTGDGASISNVTTLQDSPSLGGTFTLMYDGWSAIRANASRGGQGFNSTRPLPFDANASYLADVLHTDLNLTVIDIDAQTPDPRGGRKWVITFGSDWGDFDINELTSDPSGLTGNGARVWHQTGRNGTGPITGEWRVRYGGSSYTAWMPHDASAATVQEELELLESIDEVDVTRTALGDANEVSWSVTFVTVRLQTDFGFVPIAMGNLPAMEVDSAIRGTDAVLQVSYMFGGAMDYAPWEGKVMGAAGVSAGAAYLFEREALPGSSGASQWLPAQTLLGSDTNSDDSFGYSVDLDRDSRLVIIGAPYAEDTGVREKQALRCNATLDGTFSISFRGFTTDPIPANTSLRGLYEAMKGNFGGTTDLHTLPELDVDTASPWPSDSFCSNNTAVVTFRTPQHDQTMGEGDLELLSVDSSGLGDGTIKVWEVRKGTVNPDGPYSRGLQRGAAYVFRYRAREGRYVEEEKLISKQGSGQDRFGWAVSVQGRAADVDYAYVASPGSNSEEGQVDVFAHKPETGSWAWLQTLTSTLWTEEADQFGTSIAQSGDTLVVGGAAFNSSAGAIYVFTTSRTELFQGDQRIMLPSPEAGDMFGASLALYNNLLVVGCPGRDDKWLYIGKEEDRSDWRGRDTGAVYVYRRETSENSFELSQTLTASNIKPFDRLGVSVSVGKGIIVAASHSAYEPGQLAYQRAVQVVTVQASSAEGSERVGNWFRLGWKQQCGGDGENCSTRWTNPIETDASSVSLKNSLQDAFGLGIGKSELLVRRSDVDAVTGGYRFTVTFLEEDGRVPLMEADDSHLSGTGAFVTVEAVTEVPRRLRRVVHTFRSSNADDAESDDDDALFSEECFLVPWLKQRQDLFGSSISMSGDVVAVGSPNRDTPSGSIADDTLVVSNTGSVNLFSLDFLGHRFGSLNYSVTEGDDLTFALERSTRLQDEQTLRLVSLDRNAPAPLQELVREIFDLEDEILPTTMTPADIIGAGSAFARSQPYGSPFSRDGEGSGNHSRWLSGMMDYRGLGDYVPMDEPLLLLPGTKAVYVDLHTNDDSVVELPDETLFVTVYIPGMFPSLLGGLSTTVTIEDNGDGEGPYNTTGAASSSSSSSSVGFATLWDRRMYVDKLSAEEWTAAGERHGGATDADASEQLLVVGDEWATVNGTAQCGAVYVYREESGTWILEERLVPSNVHKGARFGQSVQVSSTLGGERVTVMVGAPGQASVYVFDLSLSTGEWLQTDVLQGTGGCTSTTSLFGGANALALEGDVAVVGGAGCEAAFVYTRGWNDTAGDWTWSSPEMLRSSDYDLDRVHILDYVHRQDYGAAVSVDAATRTVVVGSPLADYDKLGTDKFETYNTELYKSSARARGKVYVYYRSPSAQRVVMGSDIGLNAGTFQLQLTHRNVTSNTTEVVFDATAGVLQTALEALSNVEEVEVTKAEWEDGRGRSLVSWDITFAAEHWQDPPLLDVLWANHSCPSCTPFSDDPTGWMPTKERFNVSRLSNMSSVWAEQTTLQASDKQSGDRFGHLVAVDGEELLVSAFHSSGESAATWDFETGDLVGWDRTGAAFDHQPTFGDNPYFRPVYQGIQGQSCGEQCLRSHGQPQKSLLEGRYFVGTFERRPGAGPDNYTLPHADYAPGSVQGDEATGTLTSQVFTLGGSSISFLVGGGCAIEAVYVELLVDGAGVARATGQCRESMRKVTWDVGAYVGRAAQIRVVDSSAGLWGHINVDAFSFSWDIRGGQLNDRRGSDDWSEGLSKAHYAEKETTPRAGVAYVFGRRQSNTTADQEYCPVGTVRSACEWVQLQRLVASDKRSGDLFGSSLALDYEGGVAAVGAAHARLTGLWRERPSVYTSSNPIGTPHDASLAVAVPSMQSRRALSLRLDGAYGGHQQAGSGGPAVWQAAQERRAGEAERERLLEEALVSGAGAVYLFSRSEEKRRGSGPLIVGGHTHAFWNATETAKLQPHDAAAADSFGSSVCLEGAGGRRVFVGAPLCDAFATDAGALYVLDVGILRARFTHTEYVVVEGDWRGLHSTPTHRNDWKVSITVERDPSYASDYLTIGFATSDLTAVGVDLLAYEACFALPVQDRRPEACGDYQLTSGEVTFEPGSTLESFDVRLMDDDCRELYPKYVQLSLSIPGGNAVQGSDYMAKIRIDDDDWTKPFCTDMRLS